MHIINFYVLYRSVTVLSIDTVTQVFAKIDTYFKFFSKSFIDFVLKFNKLNKN